MTARVEIDMPALRRHLQGPEAQQAFDEVIDILKRNAEEDTPEHTGHMRKGYKTTRPDPLHRRLYHRSSFFHLLEFGSANNPPYSPMRRSVYDAGLGFRFRPDPA